MFSIASLSTSRTGNSKANRDIPPHGEQPNIKCQLKIKSNSHIYLVFVLW